MYSAQVIMLTAFSTNIAKIIVDRYADPNAILPTQRGASQMAPLAIGHPKMSKLEEIVLEHFVRFQEGEFSSLSIETFLLPVVSLLKTYLSCHFC